MKRTATLLTLGLLLAGPASAQLDRTTGDAADVIWARDIGSASIALDGTLSEPEWSQAETITFKWDQPLPFPGSGQWFDINGGNPFGLTNPVDPIDATLMILRKGNDLYFGLQAADQSIGGSPGLWDIDGIWMTTINKNNRAGDFSTIDDYFGSTRQELAFSWWSRGNGQDTTATNEPLPGLPPLLYSQRFGSAYATPDSAGFDNEGIGGAYSIMGRANDDSNGGSSFTADTGYTLEFMISVDSLGWDLTQAMSRMPISIAVQDADFNWPRDESRFSITRVWWQGQWLNTLNQGTGYIAGDPSVTVSSGAVPAYDEPEFTVPNANNLAAPTLDGALSEDAWVRTDAQFRLKYQATTQELDEGLPGVLAPYYTFYFHPDENTVLDPTEGRIKMFYRGSTLYLGLDTDDNAVNGIEGESGRDGFRLIIRSRDSTQAAAEFQADHLRFDFSVDSTGAARFNAVPDEVEVGTDLRAAVFLKPGTTAADPTNIDGGYQMEVALDLTSIGYPADLSGEEIWLTFNFFDGDALQEDAQSYSTRTWVIGERTNGASIMGYLDPTADLAVAGEDGPGEANGLRALGNAPNPFGTETAVRYELPRAASVTVEVYDVLGRLVRVVEPGLQPAGRQQATVDAAGLSAGAYVYRVRLEDGTAVTGRMVVVR